MYIARGLEGVNNARAGDAAEASRVCRLGSFLSGLTMGQGRGRTAPPLSVAITYCLLGALFRESELRLDAIPDFVVLNRFLRRLKHMGRSIGGAQCQFALVRLNTDYLALHLLRRARFITPGWLALPQGGSTPQHDAGGKPRRQG